MELRHKSAEEIKEELLDRIDTLYLVDFNKKLISLSELQKATRETVDKAFELYSSTQREAESKWIDVKERLPELHETVVVKIAGTVVSTAWTVERKDKIFWEDAFSFGLEHITHWQPLPNP